jgi:hypothetical protein
MTGREVEAVARAGLLAQKKLAWGNAWERHFFWPDTPEQIRAYPHNPRADVGLAREFARAAISALDALRETLRQEHAGDDGQENGRR